MDEGKNALVLLAIFSSSRKKETKEKKKAVTAWFRLATNLSFDIFPLASFDIE